MADIPTNEPTSLRAGDTWKWTRSLSDYPAPTWTLKYRFKHPTASGFEITASASGNDHAVTVAASTSTAYTAGTYSWIAWVESGAEKFTVDTGSMEVQADYRAVSAAAVLDDRSHARKMLAAIEAWLESRDPGVAEYEIAGRRMKYWDATDLIKWRQKYKNEVAAETNAELLAKGEGIGRKIQFRM
jgi:hypothetical protein